MVLLLFVCFYDLKITFSPQLVLYDGPSLSKKKSTHNELFILLSSLCFGSSTFIG